MGKRVLFLTLKVFSATGGIEKVCRVAGKALYETGLQYGATVKIFSMYGPGGIADGNKYFPQLLFKSFNQHKISFVLKSLLHGCKSNIVLLSHINLLLVGWLIKKCKPSTKIVLLAHGIEVWQPLPSWKKKMLGTLDLILPVSNFTKEKMKSLYGLPEESFVVINNCLDPFLELPLEKGRSATLLNRYGLKKEQPVLLTVSRMVDTEQYKGYDKVLRTMPELMKLYPGIRYLLVGKTDGAEQQRLDQLIENLNIKEAVIFTGFISDEELAAHFRLADIFVMPSEKEGFGIVFIEAMFYGLPVIAGNKDGSADALCNGEMGLLTDPENIGELTNAIRQMLDKKEAWLPDQQKLMNHFSYEGYKEKLKLSLGV